MGGRYNHIYIFRFKVFIRTNIKHHLQTLKSGKTYLLAMNSNPINSKPFFIGYYRKVKIKNPENQKLSEHLFVHFGKASIISLHKFKNCSTYNNNSVKDY